jgi:predicted nucleotidyltransferase component of viral defense system
MILHESPQELKDAIEATAGHLNLRPVFVEKDYWVTYVLRNLALSGYVDNIVFKGGTSLSKAYNCIKRFSEDIDLAVLSPADYSAGRLKALLKEVTNEITRGLNYLPNHPDEKKFGRNRTTVYAYNKVLEEKNFGVVSENIQVEINCLANPVPHTTLPIQCYIAQFLKETGKDQLIEEYGLQSFTIKVLSLQRTYFEKVLSINRLSYEGIDSVRKKVRHFYDIHQLHYHAELAGKILAPTNFEIIYNVRKDDEDNPTMNGPWKGRLVASSPLFADLDNTWQKLVPEYQNGLSDLIYSKERPSSEAILAVIKEIKEFVTQFDDAYPPVSAVEPNK